MSVSRISIVLTEDENERLRQAAMRDCRRVRDQARYILLSSLGMPEIANNTMPTNNKSDVNIRQDSHAAFVGSNP